MADGEEQDLSLSDIDEYVFDSEGRTYTVLQNVDLQRFCANLEPHSIDGETLTEDENGEVFSSQFILSPKATQVYENNGDVTLDPSSPTKTRSQSVFNSAISSEFAQKPRDSYVSSLISLTKNNVNDLKNVRYQLFSKAIETINFPYAHHTLKDRRKTACKGTDSVQIKLAKDCFHLLNATKGEFSTELGDIFTIVTKQKANYPNDSFKLNFEDGIGSLDVKENIVKCENDLIRFRGEFNKEVELWRKTLNEVKGENAKLKSEVSKLSTNQCESDLALAELRCELLSIKHDLSKTTDNLFDTKLELRNLKDTVISVCDSNLNLSGLIDNLDYQIEHLSRTSDQYASQIKNIGSRITNAENVCSTNLCNSITEVECASSASPVQTRFRPPSYSEAAKTTKSPVIRPIPAVINTDQCAATIARNVFRGRPKLSIARFYIGGISKDSSESGLKDYLDSQTIRYTYLRFFNNPRKRYNAAQVNVPKDLVNKMLNQDTWPAGIHVKPWLSWSKFTQEKQLSS